MMSVTVHLDTGSSNSNTIDSPGSAGGYGHAWLEVTGPNGGSQNFGFWPAFTANFTHLNGPGVVRSRDTSHLSSVDYSRTFPLTFEQYERLTGFIRERAAHPGDYLTLDRNCTTFVYEALVVAGIAGLPSPHGWTAMYPGFPFGYADSPAVLARALDQAETQVYSRGPTDRMDAGLDGGAPADDPAHSYLPDGSATLSLGGDPVVPGAHVTPGVLLDEQGHAVASTVIQVPGGAVIAPTGADVPASGIPGQAREGPLKAAPGSTDKQETVTDPDFPAGAWTSSWNQESSQDTEVGTSWVSQDTEVATSWTAPTSPSDGSGDHD